MDQEKVKNVLLLVQSFMGTKAFNSNYEGLVTQELRFTEHHASISLKAHNPQKLQYPPNQKTERETFD